MMAITDTEAALFEEACIACGVEVRVFSRAGGGWDRHPECVEDRRKVVRWLRERKLSLPEIARCVGAPSHGNIVYMLKDRAQVKRAPDEPTSPLQWRSINRPTPVDSRFRCVVVDRLNRIVAWAWGDTSREARRRAHLIAYWEEPEPELLDEMEKSGQDEE